MKSCGGRAPFRPAMPIDSAAPAYHSSALKIARLTRFLSVRLGEAGSLTLHGFEFFVFDIAHPFIHLPQPLPPRNIAPAMLRSPCSRKRLMFHQSHYHTKSV
jgi:hypothetical protein